MGIVAGEEQSFDAGQFLLAQLVYFFEQAAVNEAASLIPPIDADKLRLLGHAGKEPANFFNHTVSDL